MPSSIASKYDASMAYPLGKNSANESVSKRLCYHRFYDDAGTEQEVFVPPGKEQEIIRLDQNEDWNALLKFPAFSDRPPARGMQANCVTVPGVDGTTKSFYVPEDEAKQARVCELVTAQDYQTLEQEFEPWSKYKLSAKSPYATLLIEVLSDGQPHSHVKEHEEWERGVERCARAREVDAERHAE